jgi:Tol biopolymer transport system component
VRRDALAVGILADVEWNGLQILGHVGSGVISAHTAELQGSLIQLLVVLHKRLAVQQSLTASQELSLVPCWQTSGQVLRWAEHQAPILSVILRCEKIAHVLTALAAIHLTDVETGGEGVSVSGIGTQGNSGQG